MKGVSVVLCCYNSVNRLPKTLSYLAKQEIQKELVWELIIVNNNSTDTTASVAVNIWQSYHTKIPLTVVEEHKPGLSFAREKGISIAKYNVILFCDDDNWLDKNYVQTVFNTFSENDNLGALGGWCDAVFETYEPEWFSSFRGNFAVGKPQESSGFLVDPKAYLYGAGLAINRQVYKTLKHKNFSNILTDRKGKKLSSGGDVELIYALKILGYKVYFNENLHFYHFMTKQRLSWGYLIKLRESMYWSNFVLSIYIDAQKNTPYHLKAIIKKSIQNIKFINKQNKQIKKLDSLQKLRTKNQIEIKKLFLKKIYFYIATRNKLNRLKIK